MKVGCEKLLARKSCFVYKYYRLLISYLISKQAQLNAFKSVLFPYDLGQILSLPPSRLLSPPTSTFPPPFEVS